MLSYERLSGKTTPELRDMISSLTLIFRYYRDSFLVKLLCIFSQKIKLFTLS